MPDDGGVEFLDPEPEPGENGQSDDVLDTGPRRPIPRSVIGLAGLGIAVAVVLALILNSGGTPDALPSSAPATGGLPSSFVVPPPDNLPAAQDYDRTITVPNGPIEAAAVGAHGTLYVLSPGHLTTVRPQLNDVDVTELRGFMTPQWAQWHLVPVGNRVWVVGASGSRTRLAEIDAASTAVVPRHSLDQDVSSIATLDGHVYLATATAVYDIAPGAHRPKRIPGLPGALSIAADPSRHRLLLLDFTRGASVRAYFPGGSADTRGVDTVPLVKGSLRVAGSTIWLGGFGPDGAVLTRLDPTTLRPSTPSPLAAGLGPGALLVAAGEHDVWVRDGGGGDDLWCVADSGTAAQHWGSASGSVAVQPGVAYVAEHGTAVHRLHLNAACRG